MSYLLASAARATVGARSGQEDAYSVWPAEGQLKPSGDSGMLAVLADGMGGHRGGAVAGQTACATFTQAFSSAQMPVEKRLDMALHASNDAIADAVEKNSGLKGMGCTLIGAWLDDTGMRWTSVGDSLLLLYRFPDVIRLNEDHSLGSYLDEQARRNEISIEEARGNRHRNALRSALTGSKIDLVDLRGEPLELLAGDWILLASDGIASLEGDELADIMYRLRDSSPEEMAQALIAAVEAKGVPEQDNTTVVAIRVEGASETAMIRPSSNSQAEQVTLRTKRIGVVSGRKMVTAARRPPPPPPKRSTAETMLVKGPVALLLAAAAAFVLAAAIYLYKASTSLSVTPPPAVDTQTSTPPAATKKSTPGPDVTKERPATPAEPPPAERRPEIQSPPAGPAPQAPPQVVPAPVPATPPSAPPPTQPQPAPAVPVTPAPAPRASPQPAPKTQPAPTESPALRGVPNNRRTAPAQPADDPDPTYQPINPAESSPGGSEQVGPQPQQGNSPPTRGPQRRSERPVTAPSQVKDEVAKQPRRRPPQD
jgi:protein phosphatase